MLTAAQCATVAYVDEYGELHCLNEDLTDDDGFLNHWRAVSQYEAGGWQTARNDDGIDLAEEYPESHVPDCGCEDALYCDDCGAVIEDEYVDSRCADLQAGDE